MSPCKVTKTYKTIWSKLSINQVLLVQTIIKDKHLESRILVARAKADLTQKKETVERLCPIQNLCAQ